MVNRISTCALTFLVLISCAASACDDNDKTAGASITGPSSFVAGLVTAEPAMIAAEFRASATCRAEVPFDARINVNVHARHELFIRGVGFEFFDPFGRRVLPLAFPGTIELNNSILLPIPLPTTHPIPFPGQVPMSNVLVPAGGSFKAPFRLQFDCGVPARGTLFVSVETADRRGAVEVSRISAGIGE